MQSADKLNKQLSYPRKTALQGALQFSPKEVDSNWETLGVYGVGCPTRGMVLPDHSKAVSERPPYLGRSTTPKKTVTDSTPVQTGSRNMAVIQATDSSSKTSCQFLKLILHMQGPSMYDITQKCQFYKYITFSRTVFLRGRGYVRSQRTPLDPPLPTTYDVTDIGLRQPSVAFGSLRYPSVAIGKYSRQYNPAIFMVLGGTAQIENSLPQQKKFANFNEFSEIIKIRKNSYKNSLNARVGVVCDMCNFYFFML